MASKYDVDYDYIDNTIDYCISLIPDEFDVYPDYISNTIDIILGSNSQSIQISNKKRHELKVIINNVLNKLRGENV